MKLFNRSFLLAAVLAVAAAGAALFAVAHDAVATAYSYAKRAADWLTTWTIDKTATFARAEPGRMNSVVQIVRAEAFQARQMQRERVDMQARYRLCPSI